MIVNRQVAQTFRVLPLECRQDGVWLVTDRSLTETDRKKIEKKDRLPTQRVIGCGTYRGRVPGYRQRVRSAARLEAWCGPKAKDCLSHRSPWYLMTVLLVDDDDSRAGDLTQKMLADGFEVNRVRSLDEAIAYLRRASRAVGEIVVWGQLPGNRGDALRRLRDSARYSIVTDATEGQSHIDCSALPHGSTVALGG